MSFNKEVQTSSSSPFQNVESGRVVPWRVPTVSREDHSTVDRYEMSDELMKEELGSDDIDDSTCNCADVFESSDETSSSQTAGQVQSPGTVSREDRYELSDELINEKVECNTTSENGDKCMDTDIREFSSDHPLQIPGQVAAGLLVRMHEQVPKSQELLFSTTSAAHECNNDYPKYYDNNFSSTSYANYDRGLGRGTPLNQVSKDQAKKTVAFC